MENERPKSINIIGILGIVYGVFIIAAGITGSFERGRILHPVLYCVALVSFGISMIVSGSYVMRLKKWARNLLLFQMEFLIVYGGWYWWTGTGYRPWSSYLLVIPAMFGVYFFTRSKTKAHFQ